jgi:hypothetical protein
MDICENTVDKLGVDCLTSLSPCGYKLCDISVKSYKFYSYLAYYKLVVFVDSADSRRLKSWLNSYGKFGQSKDLKLNVLTGNVVVKNAVCTFVTQQAMVFQWARVS